MTSLIFQRDIEYNSNIDHQYTHSNKNSIKHRVHSKSTCIPFQRMFHNNIIRQFLLMAPLGYHQILNRYSNKCNHRFHTQNIFLTITRTDLSQLFKYSNHQYILNQGKNKQVVTFIAEVKYLMTLKGSTTLTI